MFDVLFSPLQDSYSLPKLPYSFDQLEPFIDEATVKVHYLGHHAAYANKMNALIEELLIKHPENDFVRLRQPLYVLLKDVNRMPPQLSQTFIDQGGGFVNHIFYWSTMSNSAAADPSVRSPSGQLLEDIVTSFGDIQNFYDKFTGAAAGLFGSGYVWLCRTDPKRAKQPLVIVKTSNQDSPLSRGLFPILVLDVWEHSYYLKYQNKRLEYIDNWWNLVDFNEVTELDNKWKDIIANNDKNHDEL